MKRVKKFAINDPKELAMSKERDVSNRNQVSIVNIDILPLNDVLIIT